MGKIPLVVSLKICILMIPNLTYPMKKTVLLMFLIFWSSCQKEEQGAYQLNIQIDNQAQNITLSQSSFMLMVNPDEEVFIDLVANPVSDYSFTDITNIRLGNTAPNMRFSKGWSVAHNFINYRIYVKEVDQNQTYTLTILGSAHKNQSPLKQLTN